MKSFPQKHNSFEREDQLLHLEAARRRAPKVDVEARWRQFETEHMAATASELPNHSKVSPVPHRTPRLRWWAMGSIAASLLLGIVLLHPYLLRPYVQQLAEGVAITTDREGEHLLSVAAAATHELHLSDGTLVRLSPESRLTYPAAFADGERRVQIEGEAYFEVAPDAQRPFLVRSQQADVRVLGTHFTVRAYPKENYRVSLHEGRVVVTNRLATAPETLTLNPGETAVVSSDATLTLDPDDRYHAMLLEGYFYYDNVTLGRIIEDLHRYYGVDFFVASDLGLPLHFKVKRTPTIEPIIEQLNAIHGVSVNVVNE